MNKEEVLKQLFSLSKEDILDIYEILNGYKCSMNKCKKDTQALRSLYMSGYHSTKEFYDKFKITKDNAVSELLRGNAFNIKTLLCLKEMLDLDDDILLKILKDVDIK